MSNPEDTKCKDHPDAPHGFDRNASLSEDRYVCECEYWEPPSISNDELIAELERENNMLRARNERLEKEAAERKWVGLTDEDYDELLETKDWGGSLIYATEAKLKEKNT